MKFFYSHFFSLLLLAFSIPAYSALCGRCNTNTQPVTLNQEQVQYCTPCNIVWSQRALLYDYSENCQGGAGEPVLTIPLAHSSTFSVSTFTTVEQLLHQDLDDFHSSTAINDGDLQTWINQFLQGNTAHLTPHIVASSIVLSQYILDQHQHTLSEQMNCPEHVGFTLLFWYWLMKLSKMTTADQYLEAIGLSDNTSIKAINEKLVGVLNNHTVPTIHSIFHNADEHTHTASHGLQVLNSLDHNNFILLENSFPYSLVIVYRGQQGFVILIGNRIITADDNRAAVRVLMRLAQYTNPAHTMLVETVNIAMGCAAYLAGFCVGFARYFGVNPITTLWLAHRLGFHWGHRIYRSFAPIQIENDLE